MITNLFSDISHWPNENSSFSICMATDLAALLRVSNFASDSTTAFLLVKEVHVALPRSIAAKSSPHSADRPVAASAVFD